MTEDLFTYADKAECAAARRIARRRRVEAKSAEGFCTNYKRGRADKMDRPSAEIISFPERRMRQVYRMLDSALEADARREGRAAGLMAEAPILPFAERKQA